MSEKEARSYAQKESMLILFCGQVTVAKTKVLGRSKKTLLLITDQILMLFDSKKKTPYFWTNIVSAQLTDKQIELQFTNNAKNETFKNINIAPQKSELKTVFGIIIDLLQRILAAEKLEPMKLNQYNKTESKVTGYSILARFQSYCKTFDCPINDVIKPFQSNLLIQNPTMTNTYFPVSNNVIPAILDVLPFLFYVENLILSFSDNIFYSLYRNINSIRNLYSLYIDTTDKNKFSRFFSKFEKLDSNIESLAIASLNCNADEWGIVAKTIKLKQYSSLGFHHNSISLDVVKSFQDQFSELSNCLKFLSLDYFNNLNLPELIPNISYITVLSLVGCNIQIGLAVNLIFNGNFVKLSELDLSGNICNSIIETDGVKFPPHLSKLVVNGINWKSSDIFISFLNFVFKKMNKILRLCVSYSSLLGQKDWEDVFKYLSKLKIDLSPIIAIGWDNNPVNTLFFNFLERCGNIKTLSICSYFSDSLQNDQISSLCEYLKGAKKIETLILRGSQTTKMTNRIFDVFNAMAKMKSLRQLDISCNEIGDDGISALRELLSKNPISIVTFDGSNTSSLRPIIDLYSNIPNNCKLNFPLGDSIALIDSGQSTSQDLAELREASYKMVMKSAEVPSFKSANIPKPENSPLDEPYFVYYEWEIGTDAHLPAYVKKSTYIPLSIKSQLKTERFNNEDDNKDESDENRKKKTGKNEDNKKRKKSPKPKRKQSLSNSSDEDDDIIKKRKKKNNSFVDSDDSDDDGLMQKRRKKKKVDDSEDNDSEDFDDIVVSKKRRRKNHSKSSDSDDMTPNHKYPNKNHRKNFKKNVDDSDSDFEMQTNHKKSDRKTRDYELTTIRSSVRKIKKKKDIDIDDERQPKSLTKSSTFGLYTKGHKRAGSPKSQTQITSKKMSPSKKINHKIGSDDDDSSDSEGIIPKVKKDDQTLLKKNIPQLAPVKQKPPPSLGGSGDDDSEDSDNNLYRYKKNEKMDEDFDDGEDEVSPKAPDWSFPLYYVPIPTDCDLIIQDLNEKYSVGALLTYMNNA